MAGREKFSVEIFSGFFFWEWLGDLTHGFEFGGRCDHRPFPFRHWIFIFQHIFVAVCFLFEATSLQQCTLSINVFIFYFFCWSLDGLKNQCWQNTKNNNNAKWTDCLLGQIQIQIQTGIQIQLSPSTSSKLNQIKSNQIKMLSMRQHFPKNSNGIFLQGKGVYFSSFLGHWEYL